MIRNCSMTIDEYVVNKHLLHYHHHVADIWGEEKTEELLNSLNYKEKQKLLREFNNSSVEELANRLVKLKKELERRLQNV